MAFMAIAVTIVAFQLPDGSTLPDEIDAAERLKSTQ
jgi:hypothetical protein